MHEGDVIDQRFEIEREVSSGGMGRVFRARDRHTGAPVAIKVVALEDPAACERSIREAVVLAEVHHPGVVKYVAHGALQDGARYLVMEWLEGEDLGQWLRRMRVRQSEEPTAIRSRLSTPPPVRLSVPEVVVLARRIASALGELHARSIVHRDVKPSNIFLPAGGIEQAKLLDFGTARLASPAHDLTGKGMVVGTPSYMSPEQARTEGTVTPASDVWSLGCVLYECLTGDVPFRGAHLLAILTKILVDVPTPITLARDDVPDDLTALVGRMMDKDASRRPANGIALVEELERLRPLSSPPAAWCGRRSEPSLTAYEARVQSMLFAVAHGAGSEEASPSPDALEEAVRRAGGRLEQLADGSLLVTVPEQRAPTDQASRVARAALELQRVAPALPVVLVTGRSESTGRIPVGDVVDRAVAELCRAKGGEIRLDTLTAALLDARFETETAEGAVRLVRERPAEGSRTLLGRPTPWVGRQRELTMLRSMFDECVSEPRGQAALVTAGPGMGKSRLRYELVRSLEAAGGPPEVLYGQGDSLSAGSPFVMIAPALRRSAGILDGEPLEVRREKLCARIARTVPPRDRDRIAAFLGEMIGAPFPDEGEPSLRAARTDPMLMSDAIGGAWEDWLRAECLAGPVLLVLEDLHWGDLPSVKFVDAALRALAERPFFVLALARPEVHTVFPELWSGHALQEIRLGGLSRKASAELVEHVLAERATPETVGPIVDRAGGNAFYLEELIRAVADGNTSLPDTVLGMVQARLDALGHEAKRVLRAASVFGEAFWTGGVRALLGTEPGVFDVADWLEELAAREVITRSRDTRIPSQVEYRFRHALVRDGAYEMLTQEDRALAHRLAGGWLEGVGENDALVLAEHFVRGGELARAVPWFRRAADQALEGKDLNAVIERAERAVDAGATGTELGSLRLLQSIAAYWQSRYAEAARYGEAAVQARVGGDPEWFRAVGSTIVASARLGDSARVDHWLDAATRTEPAPGAEGEQLVCLCRGAFQLIFHGRFEAADTILARIASLAPAHALGRFDALTVAQIEHVRGVRAAHVGDVARFLGHLEGAVAAFERAGDTRNVLLERTTVGWCYAELGDFAQAEALVRDNMGGCAKSAVQQAVTYARVNLGFILVHRPGGLEEARRQLWDAIVECRAVGNRRLEGWARAHLAAALHAEGDHEGSELEARMATGLLSASPGLCAWAQASLARALVAAGRADEALGPAHEAMAILRRLGGLLQGESLPPLVLAEALYAAGDGPGARAAIADACARLRFRAARLPRPEWRASFIAIPDNARTLELERAIG